MLSHLLPERSVAGCQERVLAGIPAQKMRRAGVAQMIFAAGPSFVKHECAMPVRRPVQVIRDAAIFFSCRAEERAQLRFQQHFLTVPRPKQYDQCHRIFRSPLTRPSARFSRTTASSSSPASSSRSFPACAFHHIARDSTARTLRFPLRDVDRPRASPSSRPAGLRIGIRMEKVFPYFSASFRPALRLS